MRHCDSKLRFIVGLLLLVSLSGCLTPVVEPTLPPPTNTLPPPVYSPTPRPIPTSTASATFTPTDTPTASATFTATATPPPSDTPTITPTPGPNAQVAPGANGLRLRAEPDNEAGDILTQLDELTPLITVGRSGDNEWLAVIVPGSEPGSEPGEGWVMAQYVDLAVSLDDLPVLDAAGNVITQGIPAPETGARVSLAGRGLPLYAEPAFTAESLGNLVSLTPLIVLGRTPDNRWLQVITPDNGVGWVESQYVDVFIDLAAVPAGDQAVDINQTLAARPISETATAQVTAVAAIPFAGNAAVAAGRGGLRLRAAPGTDGEEIRQLAEFAPLQIIGRTADNTWFQVRLQTGMIGWAWAAFIDQQVDLAAIPVTGQAGQQPSGGGTGAVDSGGAGDESPGGYPYPTVVSGVTSRSREIFLAGQGMGNRANVFSKVGDSITDVGYFLNYIGWGQYDLAGHGYLQPVVNYFLSTNARDGNSFANRSLAANPGWMTGSVLTPGLKPDNFGPGICNPGELPIQCEYRVTRPAVALIMLGTNDAVGTGLPEFEANLNRIVEISIEMGVIPVLSTVPHSTRADTAPYNDLIRFTAQVHDIPLWDYYGATITLPDAGLSGDGVHPSVPPGDGSQTSVFTPENLNYGYTMRNLTALQVLDVIWRQVLAY